MHESLHWQGATEVTTALVHGAGGGGSALGQVFTVQLTRQRVRKRGEGWRV